MKVIVRCRPMNGKEKGLSCAKILNIDQQLLQVGISKPKILGSELAAGKKVSERPLGDASEYEAKRFTFDGVYDDDSTQKEVYEDTAYPLLQSVFEGYNGTIFACQTHTPHTARHTMHAIVTLTAPPSLRSSVFTRCRWTDRLW